jgi:thiol:disulfide interchange protein DsbD
MTPMLRLHVSAAALATTLICVCGEASAVQAEHLDITLISAQPALVPGQTTQLGLRLRHAPHWHTYWINPGDSGLPTRLTWMLPDGYSANPVEWPAPSRFEVGGLHNFGYDGDRLLPVAIRIPADAPVGQTATLALEVKWLVCREECIPGKAALTLELPIAENAPSPTEADAALFAAARSALPQESKWTGRAVLANDRISIRIDGADLPPLQSLDVFAEQRRILDNGPAIFRRDGNHLEIEAGTNDYFDKAPSAIDLVLTSTVTNGHPAAWRVSVPFVQADPAESTRARAEAR